MTMMMTKDIENEKGNNNCDGTLQNKSSLSLDHSRDV